MSQETTDVTESKPHISRQWDGDDPRMEPIYRAMNMGVSLGLYDEVLKPAEHAMGELMAEHNRLVEQVETLRDLNERVIRERDEGHAENERLNEQFDALKLAATRQLTPLDVAATHIDILRRNSESYDAKGRDNVALIVENAVNEARKALFDAISNPASKPRYFWLIERGQPEGEERPLWWSGDFADWVTDANQAIRYSDQSSAAAAIEGLNLEARPVEHGWMDSNQDTRLEK